MARNAQIKNFLEPYTLAVFLKSASMRLCNNQSKREKFLRRNGEMNEEVAVLREKSLDRWLDEREVSYLTRLSLSTLRAHRFYRKGIPYSKVGRSVRYSWADVVSFMESRRVALENA